MIRPPTVIEGEMSVVGPPSTSELPGTLSVNQHDPGTIGVGHRVASIAVSGRRPRVHPPSIKPVPFSTVQPWSV